MEKGQNNIEKKLTRLMEIRTEPMIEYLKSSKEFYNTIGIDLENGTYDETAKELRLEAIVPQDLQAYEKMIHGGAIAALLDSSCGVVALIEASKENKKAVTIELTVKYLKPLSPNQKYICTGQIQNQTDKIFHTVGHIEDEQGVQYATATTIMLAK